MLKEGLEFAPGTSDDCKRLVGSLFTPTELVGAYREGRSRFSNGDLALVTSEQDASGFEIMPRAEYVARLKTAMGSKWKEMSRVLTIAHKAAHKIVGLPFQEDAFWLVVLRNGALPVMAVLFVTPYDVDTSAPSPLIAG